MSDLPPDQRALQVLLEYEKDDGDERPSSLEEWRLLLKNDPDTCIPDPSPVNLLTDIMHYCDSHWGSFDQAVNSAKRNHRQEGN